MQNTDRQPIRLKCFGEISLKHGLFQLWFKHTQKKSLYGCCLVSGNDLSSLKLPERKELSVILFVVADEAPPVLTGLSLPEERLSDGLQLSQLKADFLQVEGPPVLDLPHGKRVHVHKSNIHQLPGEKKGKKRSVFGWAEYLICTLLYSHSTAKSTGMFLYLESRIVRVKYLRYLKRVVESCSFKNSSSLYLKSERAKRNMICAENGKHVNKCSKTGRTQINPTKIFNCC